MAAEAKTETAEPAVAAYLKQPYTRLVVPEPDGTFRGEVMEFPGCLSTGDTPAEAYAELEEAAGDWLEAALEQGQNIPDPFENVGFSGRLVLRLPKSLHKKAARLAERDGVSLNQFIVAAVAEYAGEKVQLQNQITLNATISNNTTGYYVINAGTYGAQDIQMENLTAYVPAFTKFIGSGNFPTLQPSLIWQK